MHVCEIKKWSKNSQDIWVIGSVRCCITRTVNNPHSRYTCWHCYRNITTSSSLKTLGPCSVQTHYSYNAEGKLLSVTVMMLPFLLAFLIHHSLFYTFGISLLKTSSLAGPLISFWEGKQVAQQRDSIQKNVSVEDWQRPSMLYKAQGPVFATKRS